MRLVLRAGRIWFLRYSRFLFFDSAATQGKKLRHTVLDTTQSVLRDMTIHGYLRHPQGMLVNLPISPPHQAKSEAELELFCFFQTAPPC